MSGHSHTANLLTTGEVLLTGGSFNNVYSYYSDLYDNDTDVWNPTQNLSYRRGSHTATMLGDGRVMVAGGRDSTQLLSSVEIFDLKPSNTFTGTLNLPSDWINNTTFDVQFLGSTSDAAINAGALSNDNIVWGDWVAAVSGDLISITWDVRGEGKNLPIYLRLKDIYGQVATVVNGYVDVDTTAPIGNVYIDTSFVGSVSLILEASDNLSGVEDMQISSSEDFDEASWIPYSETYQWDNLASRDIYVRYRDLAGNISPVYYTQAPYFLFLPIIVR